MHDDIDRRVRSPADPTNKIAIRHAKVLQQGGECIGPRVLAPVDTKDTMPIRQQREAQIGADLATRTGN
jgi:hypothetical protein